MEERFDCKSRACPVCLVKEIFDLPRATEAGFRGIENTDRGTWEPDSQKRLMLSVRKTWKSGAKFTNLKTSVILDSYSSRDVTLTLI